MIRFLNLIRRIPRLVAELRVGEEIACHVSTLQHVTWRDVTWRDDQLHYRLIASGLPLTTLETFVTGFVAVNDTEIMGQHFGKMSRRFYCV